MNKKVIFILAVLVAAFVIVGYFSAFTLADEQPNIKSDELKQKMGMDISDLKETPKITREQAIEAAQIAYPDLAVSKNIKAQKNVMTYKGCTLFKDEALIKNPALKAKGYLENSPVWIVSFKGLKIMRAGDVNVTDELRKQTAHEEENVVIDANTGEALFSFTYR